MALFTASPGSILVVSHQEWFLSQECRALLGMVQKGNKIKIKVEDTMEVIHESQRTLCYLLYKLIFKLLDF